MGLRPCDDPVPLIFVASVVDRGDCVVEQHGEEKECEEASHSCIVGEMREDEHEDDRGVDKLQESGESLQYERG